MGDSDIPIDNDEIEFACDLLWFVKTRSGLTDDGEALWERLQPIRHGDFGGTAATVLSKPEAMAVVEAGALTDRLVPLDEEEAGLVAHLAEELRRIDVDH